MKMKKTHVACRQDLSRSWNFHVITLSKEDDSFFVVFLHLIHSHSFIGNITRSKQIALPNFTASPIEQDFICDSGYKPVTSLLALHLLPAVRAAVT